MPNHKMQKKKILFKKSIKNFINKTNSNAMKLIKYKHYKTVKNKTL